MKTAERANGKRSGKEQNRKRQVRANALVLFFGRIGLGEGSAFEFVCRNELSVIVYCYAVW